MSQHRQPQRIDRLREWRLRIRGAVAVEPGGKRVAAKCPYRVVVAACGEIGEVALHLVFKGCFILRMGPRRASLDPCRASRGTGGGHDDHRRHRPRRPWRGLLLGRSRGSNGHRCDASRSSDEAEPFGQVAHRKNASKSGWRYRATPLKSRAVTATVISPLPIISAIVGLVGHTNKTVSCGDNKASGMALCLGHQSGRDGANLNGCL